MTPSYPPELETHWLKIAQAETRGTAIRDVSIACCPTSSASPTASPPRAPPRPPRPRRLYLRDTRSCAAYSLFFAPQTYARLSHILAELPPFPDTPKPLRVLDLGAGTGAASWALLDHLGRRPVALSAWDHSRPALRCLHDLFTDLRTARWPEATLRTYARPPRRIRRLLRKIRRHPPPLRPQRTPPRIPPPAPLPRRPRPRPQRTPHPVRTAGPRRRRLHARPARPRPLRPPSARPRPLPPRPRLPPRRPLPRCPHLEAHAGLQILNATLHRDLRHLAYALLVLSPDAPPAADTLRARVVGSPSHAKGQTVCPACCSDGLVHNIQLLHRDFDTAGRKTPPPRTRPCPPASPRSSPSAIPPSSAPPPPPSLHRPPPRDTMPT
jgi:hypothetical protein